MHRASSIRNRTPIIANATAEVSVLVALSLAAANIGKNTRFVGRKEGRRKEEEKGAGYKATIFSIRAISRDSTISLCPDAHDPLPDFSPR